MNRSHIWSYGTRLKIVYYIYSAPNVTFCFFVAKAIEGKEKGVKPDKDLSWHYSKFRVQQKSLLFFKKDFPYRESNPGLVGESHRC